MWIKFQELLSVVTRLSDAYQHFTVSLKSHIDFFASMALRFGSGAEIGQACYMQIKRKQEIERVRAHECTSH